MKRYGSGLLLLLVIFLAPAVAGGSTDPVGSWLLDEGQGQWIYDSAPYENDGMLGISTTDDEYDPEWRSDCWNESCLSFNESGSGPGNFVAVNDSASLSFDTATLAAWIYVASYEGGSDNGIITKERQFKLAIGDGSREAQGELVGSVYNEGYCGTNGWCGDDSGGAQFTGVTVDKYTWTHVAMTWNTTHFRFFVNGSEVYADRPDTIDDPVPIGNKSYALGIGARDPYSQVQDHPLYYFDGRIDEPVVYNRALSAHEVKDLYSNSSANRKLSTRVDLETDTVLNGSTITMNGTVTCETLETDCSNVTLSVAPVGTGEPFSLSNPDDTTASIDCGLLNPGQSCPASWRLNAEKPGDHMIIVSASSLDATNESTAPIRVIAPAIDTTKLALDGTSTQLSPVFGYASTVAADATCTLNEHEVCNTRVLPTDGTTGTGRCPFTDASYRKQNTITCLLANTTFDVNSTVSTKFMIDGAVTDVMVSDTAVTPGDEVTVSCNVANKAPFTLKSQADKTNHAHLTIATIGPDGHTMTKRQTGIGDIATATHTSTSNTFAIPENATKGTWTTTCAGFALNGSVMMDADGASASFSVTTAANDTTNSSTAADLSATFTAPDAGAPVALGASIPVIVKVQDASGNTVNDATVHLNGEPMNQAGNGLYRRDLRITESSQGTLTATARVNTTRTTVQRQLHPYSSMQVNLDPFTNNYTVRDPITVAGTVNVSRPTDGVTVSGQLVDPDQQTYRIGSTDVADGHFTLTGTIPTAAAGKQLTVQVTARDQYEQTRNTTTITVNPAADGDFFLSFQRPDPGAATTPVFRGEPFTVRIRPIDISTQQPVQLDSIQCRFGGTRSTIDMTWQGDTYVGTTAVGPNVPAKNQTVHCTGTRTVQGTQFAAERSISVQVFERRLDVQVLNQDELEPGQTNTIRMNVSDGNRSAENTTITVTTNGESRQVNVTRQADGTYTGEVYIPADTRSMNVQARGAGGNVGEMEVVMDEPGGINPVWVAAIVVILLGAMSVMFFRFRTQTAQEKIADLERKKKSIEQSMKDAEKKYYKRQLDKDTYIEMMEEYEQTKTQLKNELEQLYADADKTPDGDE